jgi:Tol biopolymer transport system component
VSFGTNGLRDAFVKDTWTGEIQRVSVSAAGAEADGISRVESISGDGRYVTFWSDSNNLVPNLPASASGAYLADRATGNIRRVGDVLDNSTNEAYVSPDGSSVAFISNDPLAGSSSTGGGVFLQDLSTNAISLVSTGPDGNLSATEPAISGDGRHVAFVGVVGGIDQVFVKDLDTNNLEMVSANDAGDPGMGQGAYGIIPPSISTDGRYVVFVGNYCNLSPLATQCGGAPIDQVYVRDRLTGHTTLESIGPTGAPTSRGTTAASMSSDGQYLVFEAGDPQFAPECPVSGPQAGSTHIFERDLTTGTTTRVDNGIPGYPCPFSDQFPGPAVSADGSYVVYDALPYEPASQTDPIAVFVTRLR